MRILVGAFGHESNTFTPFLTTLDDFFARWGVETLQATSPHGSFGGIVDVLRQHIDVEIVPSVTAWAMPGGVVARDAYARFKAGILDAARDVDGVCLALHGAMRAEGLDYCEDDLLADLRAHVGPGVPITIALDMHANLIRDTMRHIDALVAYKTALCSILAFTPGCTNCRVAEMDFRRVNRPMYPLDVAATWSLQQ